jgi:VWFA-related protein
MLISSKAIIIKSINNQKTLGEGKMKIQLKSKSMGKNYTGKVCSYVIFSILLINLILVAITKGNESNDAAVNSTTQDKITLVYNDIDALNFPRIVSLVSVMNDFSFVIGVLDENNFEVREDGVRELPITVELITGGEIGINVALVIDCSGSMMGQPITDAKNAASAFVDLMQSRDQSAIVSFSHQPHTDHAFSNDKNALKTAISTINAAGGTAIFDALIHAVYLMSASMKNRAIILLTDGADKDSYYSYQQALSTLLSHEVRTFTIGLNLNQNSPEENILKEIASQTGGLYFYSPTSGDLKKIYEAIYKLLHSQYRITYTTHNPAKDGTLRHVKIDVFVDSYTSSDTANYRAPYEGSNSDRPDSPNFEVVPNPFTPNDDGLNDWTEFRRADGIPDTWAISIMDRTGRLIKQLRNGDTVWNGKDEAGITMLPGTYLYIVLDGNQAIHRGLIQLVR